MDDPLILVRAVHIAATLTLAGALLFGVLVAGPVLRYADADIAAAVRSRLLRLIWISFGFALLSGVAWILVAAGASAAADSRLQDAVWKVLGGTTLGHAFLLRLVPATLLGAMLCWISPTRPCALQWVVAAVLAVAFTLALVHSGHAAPTTGWRGTGHRAADGLHLIAASAWFGGLVPLTWLLATARRGSVSLATARDVTLRFSTLGVISVATLMVTGIVNGWMLVGGVPALVGTDYGRMLLLKIALFLLMVGVAAINRLYLTPRLRHAATTAKRDDAAQDAALRPLMRNCAIEIALGCVILLVVGALGVTPPGKDVQPVWPFPLRLSDVAFDDPQSRAVLLPALWIAAAALLLAALLLVLACRVRRRRWWLVAAGGAIAAATLAAAMPALRMLTTEAFPTTFYVSPTGYSAGSILRGASVFATHCAACHGRRGRGDGPAGRFFRVRPSDLAADHVYGHTDGDLYWWITNGIGEVMPPMGATLDENARWSVIDFVHANADAARLGTAPAKVTDVGYRAPAFTAVCPDGSTVARDQLGRRIAHLVVVRRDNADRLAALASQPRDVVTIAVNGEEAAAGAACHAADADLGRALDLFRGQDAGANGGAEYLIDGSGALRAAWAPGGKPDWRDVDVLAREIAAIRDHPAAARPTGSHLHPP